MSREKTLAKILHKSSDIKNQIIAIDDKKHPLMINNSQNSKKNNMFAMS